VRIVERRHAACWLQSEDAPPAPPAERASQLASERDVQ
jgi:hypothetical protein